MNALARRYFLVDSARAAAFHSLPFRRPILDPITKDPITLALAPEHPLARRLGRLGIAGTERDRGLAFCLEVSCLKWDGRTDNWDQGDHLAQAVARAAVDLPRFDSASLMRNASHQGERLWQRYTMMSSDAKRCALH